MKLGSNCGFTQFDGHQWRRRSHLDLVLLACVFNRLEDVPRVPASHFQAGDILTVPALDQQSCSDG